MCAGAGHSCGLYSPLWQVPGRILPSLSSRCMFSRRSWETGRPALWVARRGQVPSRCKSSRNMPFDICKESLSISASFFGRATPMRSVPALMLPLFQSGIVCMGLRISSFHSCLAKSMRPAAFGEVPSSGSRIRRPTRTEVVLRRSCTWRRESAPVGECPVR